MLLIAKQQLSRHIYGLGLLIFENHRAAAWLYFILLFPGILLHELSHFAAALMLGVPTSKVRLGPQTKKTGLELGAVATARTDFLREGLIGLAPLVLGSLVILASLYLALGLRLAQNLDLLTALQETFSQVLEKATGPGFWLGWYLIFSVSNTMLPSETDRRAWLPLLTFLGILFFLANLLGLFPQLPDEAVLVLLQILKDLSLILVLILVLDGLTLLLVLLLEKGLEKVGGRKVLY
ncbi:MAG: hypothetical protein HYX86_01420 [Chloroflexi bacterium]|nr:hypothetical protein [Chloroflexota bacterium]